MTSGKVYEGIEKDPTGAMNPTGNIIRDAWVFELIPESETCAGWTLDRLDALYDQVSDEWHKYGHQVSQLPQGLRDRHRRIYEQAVRRARALGWEPDMEE